MKRERKYFLPLVLYLLAAPLFPAQVVQTAQGKLSGLSVPNSTVTVFKGIPFAAPPVGNLRWRAPQPAPVWKGVRKADEFGASCMQLKAGERLPWTKEFMVQNQVSEDCLFLNIWTPRLKAGANLPVILFIHGGGFGEGSGAIEIYNGTNLAATDAVVVTINYRLGVFGFLAHPELTAESERHASGNYGLLDQIAALQWVKANIAPFGGDPHKVTIWGQSAGAFSVAALLASPLGSNLFERAQADSGLGTAAIPMLPLATAEQNGLRFATEHHAASLQELRALPAEALLPDPKSMGGLRFAPIVDGWVLPDTPNNLNANGKDNDVPVVTGYQAGDSMMFAQSAKTPEEYDAAAHRRYGEMAAEFESLYPAHNAQEIAAMTAASGRDRNRVSMFLWASARAKSHRQPVFTYFFVRGIPWPQHPEFGAFHSGELPYFFRNLKMLDRPWQQIDETLAANASAYLVHFAANGDPNGAGLAHWPRVAPDWSQARPQVMELGEKTGAMPVADGAKVDFWTRYFNSSVSKNSSPF